MKNEVQQKVNLEILAEGYNSPDNWAGEFFKHSTDAGSLVVSIYKEKLESFRYLFFCWWHHNGSKFMHIWIILSGPGRQRQEPVFWLKFYWKPGCCTSL